jgi:tetratricopeptide (TPR) repeat protein
LAELARELGRVSDPTARTVSEEASDEAQASGVPQAIIESARTRLLVLDDPDEVHARIRVAEELLEVADRAGDTAAAFEALTWRSLSHLELANADSFRAVLDEVAARPAPEPGTIAAREVGGLRIMHAVLEGRMAEAKRGIVAALTSPGTPGERQDDVLLGQIWTFTLVHGHIEPLVRSHRQLATLDPEGRWPAWIANTLARMGRTDEAREMFERAAAAKFEVRRDFGWESTIMLLADTCAILKDVERAPLLVQLLEPYRDRFGVFAPSAGTLRPVARDIGVLHLTSGRVEEAVGALEEALACTKRLGARLCGAQCKMDLARALRRRGAHGDAMRAEGLFAEAFADAANMGLIPASGSKTAASAPRSAAAAVAGRAVLRLDGDIWTAGLGQTDFKLADTKGIRCLHLLVSNPGREFHAADLVAILEGNTAATPGAKARARDAGLEGEGAGLGPMLDAEAKAMYRARVDQLRDDVREADEWGDSERAARAREEMEAIAHEIGAGIGLGGRDRAGPSVADRARVNITRMIKRAIEAIGAHDAALARHLTDSIRRGTFCSYEPDPARPLAWELSRPG